MAVAHTPGPWKLETLTTSCGIVHKVGPFPWKRGKQNHACIYADWPGAGSPESELLANARLIATAPELLEALLAMCRNFPTDTDMLAAGWEPLEIETACTAYDKARAAIAKATGEAL